MNIHHFPLYLLMPTQNFQLFMRLKSIEILNDAKGKPEVILHGEAKEFADKKNLNKIIVSMSHTNNYAVSNAILWKDG